jgi:hypothetical protein
MVDVLDLGSAFDDWGSACEESYSARSFDVVGSFEWAVESVLDLRDASPPTADGSAATGLAAATPAANVSAIGACSSRSSGSNSGEGHSAHENEPHLADLEVLLQALLSEGTLLDEEGINSREAAPPQQLTSRRSRDFGLETPTAVSTLSFLPSAAATVATPSIPSGGNTVPRLSLDGLLRAGQPEANASVELLHLLSGRDILSARSVDVDSSEVAEEEVVSVYDISDEPTSVRATAQERSLLGDVSPRSLESSSVLWSSVSSTPSSGRYSVDESVLDSDALLLDSSLNAMLQRLTGEQLVEESLSRSVRRALQLGAMPSGQRLSEEEIKALPQVRFESTEQQHCSICLEAYQEGEQLTALRCHHVFHIDCLARWMMRAAVCPLCRTSCGCKD